MLKQWAALLWMAGAAVLFAGLGLWLSMLSDSARQLLRRPPQQGDAGRAAAGTLLGSLWLATALAGVIAALYPPVLPVWKLWLVDACLLAGSAGYWMTVLGPIARQAPAAPTVSAAGEAAEPNPLRGPTPAPRSRSALPRLPYEGRGDVPSPRADWPRLKTWREDRKQAYLHLVLLVGTVVFAAPFFWMASTSLKPEKQVFTNPPVWIPHPFVLANYPRTFEFLEKALPVRTYDGLLFLGNTLIIAGLSLAGTLLSASMVAYAFSRLRWPGRDFLFLLLLSTMMIPDAVTMIPRFMIFRWLGWIDTLRPLWVPAWFGGAFSVFLLRQFFLSLPNELEDAARIDGCRYWTTYWRILMPQIKPALAALAIMQFMGSWNDFMGPLIYITSPGNLPGSYALQLFQSAHSGEWTMLMCAATLWMLPVIILFFFTQRQFIEGITLTGIKG